MGIHEWSYDNEISLDVPVRILQGGLDTDVPWTHSLDLADKLYMRCDQLSGGQLQRVGIARMLYQAPELILADEPVSAMDPVLASHTLGVLNREAQRRNATLLASLHAVELALEHFPRIVGVRDGRILFDKPASEIGPDELAALYANEQLQHAPSPPAAATPPLNIPRC